MPATTTKPTVRKASTRRRSTAAPASTPPPVAAPQFERASHRRLTPAQKRLVPTEACLVQAPCRCVGMLMPAGSRLDGDYPVVAVRIANPCSGGHPERVSSGVIARFAPHAIRRVAAAG